MQDANLHGQHVGQLIHALLELIDVPLLRLYRALKRIPVCIAGWRGVVKMLCSAWPES